MQCVSCSEMYVIRDIWFGCFWCNLCLIFHSVILFIFVDISVSSFLP